MIPTTDLPFSGRARFRNDLIARLDLYIPWLLPALETLELTIPSTVRLLICLPLMAWLMMLRHRHAESAASRFLRVAL